MFLNVRRRFSASLGFLQTGLSSSRPDVDQRQSALCRLPAELRNQIWDLTVANNIFFVYRVEGGRPVRRIGRSDSWESADHFVCLFVRDFRFEHTTAAADAGLLTPASVRALPFGRWHGERGCGGLVASCRRLYAETAALLYACNVFVFHSADALHAFYLRVAPVRRVLMPPQQLIIAPFDKLGLPLSSRFEHFAGFRSDGPGVLVYDGGDSDSGEAPGVQEDARLPPVGEGSYTLQPCSEIGAAPERCLMARMPALAEPHRHLHAMLAEAERPP